MSIAFLKHYSSELSDDVFLLVVSIMEGTICNTKEGLGLGIVAIFAIAF